MATMRAEVEMRKTRVHTGFHEDAERKRRLRHSERAHSRPNNPETWASPHPELQVAKMKLMAVAIAALSLISTTWAQGRDTQNGRKSKPMQTVNDITIVAP